MTSRTCVAPNKSSGAFLLKTDKNFTNDSMQLMDFKYYSDVESISGGN